MLPPKAPPQAAVAPSDGWLERFEEFALAFYAEHEVPGGAVSVVHGGGTVYSRGFGSADVASGRAATPGTLFGLASLSKSFTTLTLLAVAAQGGLALDEPVSSYLPGFDYPGLNPREPVRLWHLASHSSGLPPLRALGFALDGQRGSIGAPALGDYGELLAYLREAPGERAALPSPGRYMSYSNEGLALLGAVLEEATGTGFGALFEELVAGPLGLDGATFDGRAAAASGRLTTYYSKGGSAAGGSGEVGPVPRDDLPAYLPTGFAVASADGLAAYLRGLLAAAGGGVRGPLGPALLAELTRGRAWSSPGTRYALGWSVMDDFRRRGGPWRGQTFGAGFAVVRHGGSLAGISSHQGFVPELGLGVAVLANLDDVPVSRLFAAALNAYLGLPLTASLYPVPGPEARPGPDLARTLAGVYASGEPWGRLELVLDASGRLSGLTGEDAADGGELRFLNESEFVLVADDGAWDGGRFVFGARSHCPEAVQFGTRWLDRA